MSDEKKSRWDMGDGTFVITGLAPGAVGTTLASIGQDCKNCHQEFRN